MTHRRTRGRATPPDLSSAAVFVAILLAGVTWGLYFCSRWWCDEQQGRHENGSATDLADGRLEGREITEAFSRVNRGGPVAPSARARLLSAEDCDRNSRRCQSPRKPEVAVLTIMREL